MLCTKNEVTKFETSFDKDCTGNNDKGRKGTREGSSFFRSIDEIRRKFAQEKLEEDFLLRLESTGRKIIS
jgi:hypothetical protein